MEYTCPHCGYKMTALEADAAYDGCPSCRKRIEWEDYLTGPEIGELEHLADEECWQREADRREIRDRKRKEEFLAHNDTDAFGMCFSDADTGL